MNVLQAGLLIWMVGSVLALLVILCAGVLAVRKLGRTERVETGKEPSPPIEILVPLKGLLADQETILSSLLLQDYPSYHVVFILEDEGDEAAPLIELLQRRHPHVRRVIAGISTRCAQKNHNLIAGVRDLLPDTEIIVFCDGSNMADPGWLTRFTRVVRSGEAEVVTTFRVFDPTPQNVGGVCQAVYASLLRLMIPVNPKPWGGATAIRRELFDRLNAVEAWGRTVVDDLVLGNLIDRAGVRLHVDPVNLLRSPVPNQTMRGWLGYLDRQILFPKFTNPSIWLTSMFAATNVAGVMIVATLEIILFLLGRTDATTGLTALASICGVTGAGLLLWALSPTPVSWWPWLKALYPTLFCAAFLFLRSVVVNHIDWHGRRYRPGRAGVVLRSEFIPDSLGSDAPS